jgi:hypothetical protein
MFIFVATALAGTAALGWPCQRLNWGWRNVWTTCSINSYTPLTDIETPNTIPTGFRTRGPNAQAPTAVVLPHGVFTPVAANALPTLLCSFAPNTGSGWTATLRNRCRRAIDAYGGLVKMCGAPQGLFPNRGPVTGLAAPDFLPSSGHQPHVSNVQGLTHNAQMCLLPTGAYTPANLASPQNTCPGLLGWFTVVFNACGFSNAPNLSPAQVPNVATLPQQVATYFPLGDTISKVNAGFGTVAPNTGAGYFCAPQAGGQPSSWNQVGNGFKTSRCRKALDQFGRTAARCHTSSATIAAGPAQAGGYSDPLRLLAVGGPATASAATPMGFNAWTPVCN